MKNMKKTEAIVTGSCGFIGHHLVGALKKDGYHVIGIDDLSNGNPKYKDLADEFIEVSILDYDPFVHKDVEYIFHLAALPRVSYCMEHPVETNDVNINGTLHMLEIARHLPNFKKFIYSSSSSVYGEQLDLPVTETTMPNIMNHYAVQKMAAELYVETYRKVFKVPSVSLRYFNVYGEDQDGSHPYATVVAKFLDLKKKGEPLTIHGDGEQTRDMTYVQDVVKANMLSALSLATGVFNIANGESYSVNQIASYVGGKTVAQPARDNEPRDTLANITKASILLRWAPTNNLKTWLSTQ